MLNLRSVAFLLLGGTVVLSSGVASGQDYPCWWFIHRCR